MTNTVTSRSRRDITAGLIFIVIAAGFAVEAMNYQLGTALRMGPGFMPLMLAGGLAGFGLLIAIQGFRRHDDTVSEPVAWRGILLICLALAVFGYAARSLGLVPIVALCTFLSALASRNNSIVSALIMAAAMSALCYLIFKIGLGITLPTFGPVFAL
ncbi:tripartite tricarboxylate transporter TctB family protein [Aureimonas frigidaquae]|uniref:tripartite tricarboxylate transporter TctB family protein n=1 Tax=Aureimonas frigidaquae TaxID=424757 RepID=UPI000781E150|nr:tripartite tricarboxylate transporter TctB family protein [Aureimonas frigidaquae]